METGYATTVKLTNGSEKIIHIQVLPGDIVRVVNAGAQYSCGGFDDYFGCRGNKTHVSYDRYFRPTIKDKDNFWLVIGVGVHPSYQNQIILCLANRKGKCCVIGEDGIKFFKHGRFTKAIEKIYQIDC